MPRGFVPTHANTTSNIVKRCVRMRVITIAHIGKMYVKFSGAITPTIANRYARSGEHPNIVHIARKSRSARRFALCPRT